MTHDRLINSYLLHRFPPTSDTWSTSGPPGKKTANVRLFQRQDFPLLDNPFNAFGTNTDEVHCIQQTRWYVNTNVTIR